ncbi:9123_t:CDS:2 [Entrophospora sp. SA101]|nr:5972_t:CDS:2 [Entrophospora sp. SA101]CAJ0842491.1 9123_t:CDS:2 [Entrophospora sp. SA101]
MNQYQYLKYAIIGLNLASRTASAASFFKPELRIVAQYTEPTKQFLIQGGNYLWQQELAQQKPIPISFQETEEGVLIADLIEKTLPISAIPSVFDPEKDIDYRVLLRDDLPNYYADQEEYQEKIAAQT